MRLEAEKNKLENLLTNNLIRRRDEVLHALQEISLEDRKRQLYQSKEEVEKTDKNIKKVNKEIEAMDAKVKEITKKVYRFYTKHIIYFLSYYSPYYFNTKV